MMQIYMFINLKQDENSFFSKNINLLIFLVYFSQKSSSKINSGTAFDFGMTTCLIMKM